MSLDLHDEKDRLILQRRLQTYIFIANNACDQLESVSVSIGSKSLNLRKKAGVKFNDLFL